MKIRDKFDFLNEGVSVKFVFYVERGYRIIHQHFLFFSFLNSRLRKAIFGRKLKLPLSRKVLKQIFLEADFVRQGSKQGYQIVSQRLIGDIIELKIVRDWEIQTSGFKKMVIKMKFAKPKAEAIKYYTTR